MRVLADEQAQDQVTYLSRRAVVSANAVSGFRVEYNTQVSGITASFTLDVPDGIETIALLRNISKDDATANVLQTWTPIAGQTYSYTDSETQATGEQTLYYWIRLVPLNNPDAAVTIGPQSLDVNSDQIPPTEALDFDVSHLAGNGSTVTVCVSFTPPVLKFGSLQVQASGYRGNAQYVAVGQTASSPYSFALEQTGEAITLRAIAVSPSGISALTGPTKALTLSAGATVPAKIMGVSATAISTGVQVGFTAGAEPTVTVFQVWRAALGGGFGSASNIGTVTPTGAGTYSYLDTNGLTGQFEWYIVAVNPTGSSAASTAANILAVQSSAQLPPNAQTAATNNATIDSVDAGADATARIYGPTGVGNGYLRYTGYNPSGSSRPYGTVSGLVYATVYYILYTGAAYIGVTSYPSTLPDGYEFVAKMTTCAGGGGGGVDGGGGTGGDFGGSRLAVV